MENSNPSSNGKEPHYSSKEAWFSFTKEELRQGATDSEEEMFHSQRIATCSKMAAIGKHLDMPQQAIATSMVYFHRFYAINKFNQHDKFIMATTCVFLASKTQESFRPLEQIIRESHKEFYKTDIHPASESFSKLKNTILKCEMSLLQTLGFEFSAELPYSHLVKMYKTWKATLINPKETVSDEKELIQISWNFLNDSFKIPLCLQYKPSIIAAGMLGMASNFLKKFADFPFHQHAKPEVLKSVEDQMKVLYEIEKKNAEKRPQQTVKPSHSSTSQPSDANPKSSTTSHAHQHSHISSVATKTTNSQPQHIHPYQTNSTSSSNGSSTSGPQPSHPYQTSIHSNANQKPPQSSGNSTSGDNQNNQ